MFRIFIVLFLFISIQTGSCDCVHPQTVSDITNVIKAHPDWIAHKVDQKKCNCVCRAYNLWKNLTSTTGGNFCDENFSFAGLSYPTKVLKNERVDLINGAHMILEFTDIYGRYWFYDTYAGSDDADVCIDPNRVAGFDSHSRTFFYTPKNCADMSCFNTNNTPVVAAFQSSVCTNYRNITKSDLEKHQGEKCIKFKVGERTCSAAEGMLRTDGCCDLNF